MKETYYQMLGVSQSADAKTLKDAFRKLAKKYHPDVNGDNPEAEKKFKDVNEAYKVLSDDAKRKEYDLTLGAGGRQTGNRSNTASKKKTTPQGGNPFANMNFGMDFDDMWGVKTEFSESDTKKAKVPDGAPDFMNANQQFANFFGFKPR